MRKFSQLVEICWKKYIPTVSQTKMKMLWNTKFSSQFGTKRKRIFYHMIKKRYFAMVIRIFKVCVALYSE